MRGAGGIWGLALVVGLVGLAHVRETSGLAQLGDAAAGFVAVVGLDLEFGVLWGRCDLWVGACGGGACGGAAGWVIAGGTPRWGCGRTQRWLALAHWQRLLASQDGELAKNGFRHGLDLYFLHLCCGRPLAAPGDEGLYCCVGTGDDGFDVPGCCVLYPPGEGELEGLIFGAGAVGDALDPAFYEEMNGWHVSLNSPKLWIH